MKNYVSASVLSADMLRLENEIKRMEAAGIDMLHFDVMDGVFVNNISYGLPILEQVRKATDLTLDVHLMITDPLKYARRFAEAGADYISFHTESVSPIGETIAEIKAAGAKAALAIKPATPAEEVFPYLSELSMVLVMTVEPGFGGQSFMPETMDKVAAARRRIDELGLDIRLEVDGGINGETGAVAVSNGADVLVSGSYLFKAGDMRGRAEALRSAGIC